MTGLRDLLASERGVWFLLVLAIATLFVIVGTITGEQWLTFVGTVTAYLAASKTATGYIESRAPKP